MFLIRRVAFFSLKSEPCRARLESIRQEPSQLYTCLFLPWLSKWRFTFKLRRILAAGSCGRMMPEVPPRRIVPSLLLNLTLGFTKRALCLRWQDALATDLEKVAETGCLVRKREAGDVSAPSGTFHGTAVGDALQSLSRPSSSALSFSLIPLSISVPHSSLRSRPS